MKTKPFTLTFTENYYTKGDILTTDNNVQLIVLKVPDLTRWKRFLRWLGFNIPYTYQCKVKQTS